MSSKQSTEKYSIGRLVKHYRHAHKYSIGIIINRQTIAYTTDHDPYDTEVCRVFWIGIDQTMSHFIHELEEL